MSRGAPFKGAPIHVSYQTMELKMSIEQGTFVQKYDLLGCIQCGRCTGGCPVTVRTPLNVRRFVYDTVDDNRLEELSESPDIWDCTTCNTCKKG